MKSKYLFLDFDGVLHPDRYSLSNYDPDRVFRSNEVFSQAPVLAGLITEFPCQIIISSSWRFTYNLEEMKEKLDRNSFEEILRDSMNKYLPSKNLSSGTSTIFSSMLFNNKMESKPNSFNSVSSVNCVNRLFGGGKY